MKNKILGTVVTILFLVPIMASADPILVSGSFGGSSDNGGSIVTSISGSWEGVYEDALVSATGSSNISFGLNFLLFGPNPLGTTIFDTSNTIVQAFFNNGNLGSLILGGLANGGNLISSDDDDFVVAYLGDMTVDIIAWSIASEPFNITDANRRGGSFVAGPATQVPEPGTLTLFGIGLLGLGLARRKAA